MDTSLCAWFFKPIQTTITAIDEALIKILQPGDAVLIMSNRGFGNIYQELITRIDSWLVAGAKWLIDS